ncbi:nuclear transport factor 2 family protein [Streptomyces sp. NPDC093064]|uniref:nuclear transport factor 2 family protein n=1 Tax=unclassified Streptomyces TaxID=2593676 RepID=UPI0036BD60CA
MSTMEDRNKAIVIEAFDTLFNQRDYTAAERFWSPDYIQHSAHIPPGRDGLFDLIKSAPAELRHDWELAMAEGDMVIVRGRFTGHGQPAPWIAVDFVRLQDGVLVEHWDVIEDEVSRKESVSGLPMYGDTFPEDR